MVDISHAINIPGWMSVEELTYLAEAASKSNIIVEVGSWKGRSTIALAANTPVKSNRCRFISWRS